MAVAMWHLLRVVGHAGWPRSHAVLWAAADYFERHDELILNIQHAVVDNSIFIFTDCLVIII